MKKITLNFLITLLTSCQALPRPQAGVGAQTTASGVSSYSTSFVHKILNTKQSGYTIGISRLWKSGFGVFPYQERHILLRLKNAQDIGYFLSKYNLELIDQERVRKIIDLGKFTEERKLPLFLLRIKNTDSLDTSALDDLARRSGLDGDVSFESAAAAATFMLPLKIEENDSDKVVGAFVNSYSALPGGGSATQEGNGNTAPNNGSFWWVAEPSSGISGASLIQLGKDSAWDYADGRYRKVAVLDNGFLSANSHDPIISKRRPDIYNAYKDNFDIGGQNSGDWHGRKVSSVIFSPNNDNAGTIGVAPEASPFFVQIGDSSLYASDYAIARGIDHAVDWGADVINMSFYAEIPWGQAQKLAYTEAIKSAYRLGVIEVACTGNKGDKGNTYPSAYWEVIGVSGYDSKKNKPSWANSVDADIYAPCDNVAVAEIPGVKGYTVSSGTSFSSPMVAGAIALGIHLSAFPPKMENARDYLRERATNINGMKALNILNCVRHVPQHEKS